MHFALICIKVRFFQNHFPDCRKWFTEYHLNLDPVFLHPFPTLRHDRYRAAYLNKWFVLLTAGYIMMLIAWAYTDGFAITVSGALGHPVLTSRYWDPLTNFFEVSTWWYVEASFVAIAWIKRQECRAFEK